MVEEPNLSSSVTPLDLKGQGKEEVGRGKLCRVTHLERTCDFG